MRKGNQYRKEIEIHTASYGRIDPLFMSHLVVYFHFFSYLRNLYKSVGHESDRTVASIKNESRPLLARSLLTNYHYHYPPNLISVSAHHARKKIKSFATDILLLELWTLCLSHASNYALSYLFELFQRSVDPERVRGNVGNALPAPAEPGRVEGLRVPQVRPFVPPGTVVREGRAPAPRPTTAVEVGVTVGVVVVI